MEKVDQLQVVGDAAVLQTGTVGAGKFAKTSTYALIDVRNQGDSNLDVSLGGALVGSAGEELQPVRPERLRIPGHGVRTFALVADPPGVVQGARGVSPRIVRSKSDSFPPSIVIEEGRVYEDHGKVVAKAWASNKRKGTARAVIIAGFYGAEGRPMARGMEVFAIDGGQRAAVEFVGPEGSKSAYIFVGDVVY